MRLIVVALLGIEITIIALASAASAATFPEGQPASSGQYETGFPGWGDGPALSGRADLAAAISDAYPMAPAVFGPWGFERLMMPADRLEDTRDWPVVRPRWDHTDEDSYDGWAGSDRPHTVHARPFEPHAVHARPFEPHAVHARPFEPHAVHARPFEPHAVHARPFEAHARHFEPDEAHARPFEPDTNDAGPVEAPVAAAPSKAVVRAKPKARPEASKARRSAVRTGVAVMPHARRHAAHKRAQVDLTRVMPRQAAIQLSHATASGWLRSAGLRTKSSGNCTSKHMHHCTSLDSVRTGTIAGMIELKRDSRCPIMVTGGTEEGHAPGQYSHGNGYKLDITHNRCIDHYITKHHDKAGVRSDGAALYRSGSGTIFADESDHWDILFR
ncbi:hypothetical protein [Nonomuraea zeae]|uniref:Uncharacterized protein n=1 Tax=Nonomuraea zeae TaxID=1642303 RepID=A0A5S4GNQ9_9ACTN|nr:hypothetical protein [Nonomuraea zeae]TMR34533.1 hypothetical protein ETD85_16335 [Nonomuraea zeae]